MVGGWDCDAFEGCGGGGEGGGNGEVCHCEFKRERMMEVERQNVG